ncbi:MAG: hypothetical protein HRT72_07145 [Flavobacteriales bacterium]|nr:hypothetical protein [Flavobacteriales bacterium]
MKVGCLILSFIAFNGALFAQSEKYSEQDVLNSNGAIEVYERLNGLVGGDSVRVHNGYACDGWIEDYYTSGELLHKGYYEDGQLKIYKNYYKNKQLERQFKSFDNVRSSMLKFYPNGIVRSDAQYKFTFVDRLEERLEDNQVVRIEEMHESSDYYTLKQENYNNGAPRYVFKLTNHRSVRFLTREYYENGQLRIKGESTYEEHKFDCVRDGKWIYYSAHGEVEKEEKYANGLLE